MTHCRFLKFMGIIAVLAIGSGCTLYQPRPVTFSVRDWDTGQPVVGAQVKVDYLAFLDFGLWFASVGPREGVTDKDGNLTLVVDPQKRAFHLNVSADSYVKDGDGINPWSDPPRWKRYVPGPWYSVRDEYEVRLIRGPRPTADVTFPNGYQGVVVVKFADEDKPTVEPHKRKFCYKASARGLVEIKERALFESAANYDRVHARLEGGSTVPTFDPDRHQPALPGSPKDDEVALRFVTLEWKDHTWLYVLGTAAEAETVKRSVWPD